MKCYLLKLFVAGMTIASEPGVVPPLFSALDAYSEDESVQYRFGISLSWPDTLFIPHFKHFTLSVGLIWPHAWQCHCSTDAIEPILIHTWLCDHNNTSFYKNNLMPTKNENSWSTMLFVYYFFLAGVARLFYNPSSKTINNRYIKRI